MVLKPCCLPGKISIFQELEWNFKNGYSFTAKELYDSRFDYRKEKVDENVDEEKEDEKNEEKSTFNSGTHSMKNLPSSKLFNTWSTHLLNGVDVCPEVGGEKRLEAIHVQKQHFQNMFIFASK